MFPRNGLSYQKDLRLNIPDLIDKYIGRPFEEEKFDCFSFLVQWYQDQGIDLPDYRHNGYWQGEQVSTETYFKLWRKLEPTETPKENDAIFMTAQDGRLHMGIVIGDGTYIHCMRREGVVRSPMGKHQKLFEGIYRLKILDD